MRRRTGLDATRQRHAATRSPGAKVGARESRACTPDSPAAHAWAVNRGTGNRTVCTAGCHRPPEAMPKCWLLLMMGAPSDINASPPPARASPDRSFRSGRYCTYGAAAKHEIAGRNRKRTLRRRLTQRIAARQQLHAPRSSAVGTPPTPTTRHLRNPRHREACNVGPRTVVALRPSPPAVRAAPRALCQCWPRPRSAAAIPARAPAPGV